jgi:tripartite-type tricarboxylate transporter receptor subunit TctC
MNVMRHLLVLVSILLAALPAAAQEFPTRALRVICAFPPGGPVDVTSRALALELNRQLGQPVVVENRPGAGGNIGAEAAARATADGYTLFVTWNSLHAISPLIHAKMNYDPNRDLAPVSTLVSLRQVLVVNPSVPAKTVQELIALAKAQPGKVTFATPGNGTVSHMAATMFAQQAGLDLVHVPYKGSAPALADMLSGQVTMMFDHIPSALPQIKAGKLRALATSGSARNPVLPDLPTVAEAGVKGFDTSVWFGLSVPSGTPAPIVARLNAEAQKAVRSPDFIQSMTRLGYDIAASTPDQMAETLRGEIARWTPIVKASGVKID